MIVGNIAKKEVSKLNNELFNALRLEFPINKGFGFEDASGFIDWLEKNYDIKKKGN